MPIFPQRGPPWPYKALKGFIRPLSALQGMALVKEAKTPWLVPLLPSWLLSYLGFLASLAAWASLKGIEGT